jgi:hypothetical protein
MKLNQGKLASGLVEELLEVIWKYEESLYVPTVLGCIELVKQQIIREAYEEGETD